MNLQPKGKMVDGKKEILPGASVPKSVIGSPGIPHIYKTLGDELQLIGSCQQLWLAYCTVEAGRWLQIS